MKYWCERCGFVDAGDVEFLPDGYCWHIVIGDDTGHNTWIIPDEPLDAHKAGVKRFIKLTTSQLDRHKEAGKIMRANMVAAWNAADKGKI